MKTTTLTKSSGAPLRAVLAAALAALLAACAGGSGSSGFLTEAAVIQSVLDEMQCMDLDGLEICPAGIAPTPLPTKTPIAQATATATPTDTLAAPQMTATPEGTPDPFATATAAATETPVEALTPSPPSPTPTATSVPGTGIDVVGPPNVSLECATGSSPCLLVMLQAHGFPGGSVFYLASRYADSDGAWQLTPTQSQSDAPAAGNFDAQVPLPPDANAGNDGPAPLQLIALVYYGDPGFVPDTVPRLADSGADQAYALPPVNY